MRILIKEKLSEHKMKTPEGFLICTDAILARTGSQQYMKSEVFPGTSDSDMIDINRHEEDVFSNETLASFENKPVTWDHPDENVTPDNYRRLSVGYVRNVRKGTFDGQPVMIGDIIITDADAIKEILDGNHTELSCGYDCDIVQDGDAFKQSNIRGNHVALCEQGRAGIAKLADSAKDSLSKRTFRITYRKDGRVKTFVCKADDKEDAINQLDEFDDYEKIEHVSVDDNYYGTLPKERRYRYRGWVIIDAGYSSAPYSIEGTDSANEFKTLEEAKKYIRENLSDSINDKLVDEPKAWEELKKVLISKGYKLDKEGKTFTDRHHLEFVSKHAIDEKNFKEEAELIIKEVEKVEDKYKTPSTYNIGHQRDGLIRAVIDIDKKFVKDSLNDEKKVWINAKEWIELADTPLEAELIKKYFKTGWFNKSQYETAKRNCINEASKRYKASKDRKDYDAWYSFTYYLDFDEFYEENHAYDSLNDEFVKSEVIYDSTNDAPAKPEDIDTANYVIGKNGVWFARAKGEKSMLSKAFCSADKGKTWHTCNLETKTEAPSGRTQAGKYFFRTSSSKEYNGPRVAMGRNVLTWYAANGIHEVDPSQQIDHVDGNYKNDNLSNLERVSGAENIRRMKAKLNKHDSFNNISGALDAAKATKLVKIVKIASQIKK